mgnify:CR=1 FL=1
MSGGNKNKKDASTGGTLVDLERASSLAEELSDQSSVLLGLEVALEDLKAVLDKKQAALEEQQDTWGQEKTGFVAQLAQLKSAWNREQTEAAQVDEQEQFTSQEKEEEYTQEADRLQREIKLLQYQQQQVQERLDIEKEKNEALQKRLASTNDALEFEQMIFFKERQKLQQKIEDQKSQLGKVERKLQNQEDTFTNSQQDLEKQLQQEQEKLRERQQQIDQFMQEYQQGQDILQKKVKEEEKNLKEAKQTLERERREARQEKMRMEGQLTQEQERLKNLENSIVEETTRFEQEKPVLEQALQQETQKVQELSQQLQQEQVRFTTEKMTLQDQISAAQRRLASVEEQLQQERSTQEDTKNRLQYEKALIEVQRAQERSNMKDRYSALREALVARIQQEKQTGRQDVRVMTERYETQLKLTQDAIVKLQEQVDVTVVSRDNLKIMVNEVNKQVQQINQDKADQEIRYKRLLNDRTMEVTTLKTNLQDLQVTRQKREEEIEKVESSYKEIAKYSLKLTGRRINKVNPLRLLKRRNGDNNKWPWLFIIIGLLRQEWYRFMAEYFGAEPGQTKQDALSL